MIETAQKIMTVKKFEIRKLKKIEHDRDPKKSIILSERPTS